MRAQEIMKYLRQMGQIVSNLSTFLRRSFCANIYKNDWLLGYFKTDQQEEVVPSGTQPIVMPSVLYKGQNNETFSKDKDFTG